MKFNEPELNKQKIGSRIRTLRKKKYLSMEQLSSAIKVSGKSTISNWEKGLSIPKQDNLKNLSNFFKVSARFILYGTFEEFVWETIKANCMNPIILDVSFELLNKDNKVKNKSEVTEQEIMKIIKDRLHIILFSIKTDNQRDKSKEITIENVLESTHNLIDTEVHESEYNIFEEIKNIKEALKNSIDDDRIYNGFNYGYGEHMSLDEFISENKLSADSFRNEKESIMVYFKTEIDNLIFDELFEKLDEIEKQYTKAIKDNR